jgi:hypothetical protein
MDEHAITRLTVTSADLEGIRRTVDELADYARRAYVTTPTRVRHLIDHLEELTAQLAADDTVAQSEAAHASALGVLPQPRDEPTPFA